MSAGSAWLAVWLALPLLGAPLLAHPAYRRFSTPARVVLAGAAGAALLSFVMTLFAIVGFRWAAFPLALAAAALCLALRLGLRDSAAVSSPAPDRERFANLLSGAAVAAALAATVSGAAASSDLLLFWGPKAQAFAAARTIDAGFLASAQASHMHPYYPPLVTNLDTLATVVAGRFPWRAAALTLPLILAALAVALPSLLRQAERPEVPAAVSALAVSSLALLGAEADVAGNADLPLLLFELLGLALLLAPGPVETPRLLLAGILFAGAATAKVEGLPFVLAAVFFFVAGRRREGRIIRPAGVLLGPSVLSLGVWFLFGLSRHAFSGYGEYGSFLETRWDRLGLVLSEIGRALWSNGFALPYLVPLAVLLASRSAVRRLPLCVAGTLALFLAVTYMLPVLDPASWIAWSAARTFAPVPALLALSLAAAARRGQRKNAVAATSERPEIQSPATKDRGQ